MIAWLKGSLLEASASSVILNVGGVGYAVSVPVSALNRLPAVGEETSLHVHTLVREDEITLYGFSEKSDKKAFEMLIGVSGVGPKAALSALSAMSASEIMRAVQRDDSRALTRIPGIGLKTAQRLILELREKAAAFDGTYSDASAVGVSHPDEAALEDVVDGLIGLGFNRNEARRAAEKAIQGFSERPSTAAALKAAINLLTGSGGN